MFSKLVVFSALATLAAATPVRRAECSTGPIQCCNSTTTAGDKSLSTLFGLLGIVVSDVTAIVGVGCSPISVIGVGGNSCSASPLCCENNSFHGLVALGCVPVNLNL
ncbi:hypothetical protein HGRIS_013716 [Hohenbuehelia grisea]|uniref:Hydrophobin n=1 Tax=Hohenbuehelia grisea TaxID=104357 RepID=A0ABR3IWH7_9AGAR